MNPLNSPEFYKLQSENPFHNTSKIKKENAVVYTPTEFIISQFQKLNDYYNWENTNNVLSLYDKTGKYSIMLYIYLKYCGKHENAENMINIIVPSKSRGKKIQGIFNLVTGKNIPSSNIYECNFSKVWDGSSLDVKVYKNDNIKPLIPSLFQPKPVKGNRKYNIKLDYSSVKFDLVVGNPPYHHSDFNSGNGRLWPKFVRKSVNFFLKDSGFLSLVHPPSWKSYATPNQESLLRDIFSKYKIHHLEVETASEYFSEGSFFDWYVLQKTKKSDNVFTIRALINEKVESFKGSFKNLPCVPQHLNELSLKVTRKFVKENNKISIESSSSHHKNSTKLKSQEEGDFIYPIADTSAIEDPIDDTSDEKWSNKKHPLQGEKKVLYSRSGYFNPNYDDGKRGVTQDVLYTLVDSEAEANYILSLVESKLYTYFRQVNKWSGWHHKYLLKEMPYIKNLDENNINKELYEYFDLTSKEVKDIETYLKSRDF